MECKVYVNRSPHPFALPMDHPLNDWVLVELATQPATQDTAPAADVPIVVAGQGVEPIPF